MKTLILFFSILMGGAPVFAAPLCSIYGLFTLKPTEQTSAHINLNNTFKSQEVSRDECINQCTIKEAASEQDAANNPNIRTAIFRCSYGDESLLDRQIK